MTATHRPHHFAIAHGVDLLSVEVAHKADNVVVTTTHADLEESFRTPELSFSLLQRSGGEDAIFRADLAGSGQQLAREEGALLRHRRANQPKAEQERDNQSPHEASFRART